MQKNLEDADKSDIWSLGISLELLLTGRLPEKRMSSGELMPNELVETIETQLMFKDWAQAYEKSDRCREARKAKKFIVGLEKSVSSTTDISMQTCILNNLALLMQLPVKERPRCKELEEHFDKLVPYFINRKQDAKLFVSKLFQPIA